MNTIVKLGAVLLVYTMWKRGKAKEQAVKRVLEGATDDGTNWVGNSIYDRMGGRDLVSPGYMNLASGAVADPGALGRIASGIVPTWDGSLQPSGLVH